MSLSWENFIRQRRRCYPPEHQPRNVFVVNTIVDAQALQRRLWTVFGDRLRKRSSKRTRRPRVVIYGAGVVMRSAVASAIHAGVDPTDIVFVVDQPTLDDGASAI